MTQDDVIRTSPPICALDFGVPAEFAERAESYARWAVAQEREKRTGIQEFVTLPREVVEQAVEALFCTDSEEGSTAYKNELEAVKKLRAALDQAQANQPEMTPIAQRKLDSLLASGYTISGYSVYHKRKHQHGFVTGAGLVGWWKPEGVEYPQPLGEQEPVAEVTVSHVLPDLEGRCTAEIASRERLPVGAELFIHPQNLRCKSTQARLATLWGYVKEQSKRKPLTDEQLAELTKDGYYDSLLWSGVKRFARAIEAAHNIK